MKKTTTIKNTSVTVSTQDFDKLIKYVESDNLKLRQIVIGQAGYGIDGCKLCGSWWLRHPNTEQTDHNKECLAYL